MFAHGCTPLQLFPVVWIFLRSLGVICYNRLVLSEIHKKLLQGWVSHELTAYFCILNLLKLNELWSFYQNHINQIVLNHITLKRSFTNIQGLQSNFVDCESFLESNFLTFLLYVRQTWITQLILAISL